MSDAMPASLNEVTRRIATRVTVPHVLFFGACIAFAFDYQLRPGIGGTPIQKLITIVGAALALLFCAFGLTRRRRSGVWKAWLMWFAYVSIVSVSSWVNGASTSDYLRVSTPFWLCGLGILCVDVAERLGFRPRTILAAIAVMTVISFIWRPIVAVTLLQIPMGRLRHQFLSPLICFALAAGCDWAMGRRRRLLGISIALVCVAALVLSTTRAFLIAVAFTICGLVAISGWSARRARGGIRKMVGLAVATCALLLGFLAAEAIRPDVGSRWRERLTGQVAEGDVTWLTREMEFVGAWHYLTADTRVLVFGAGMGTLFSPDMSYAIPIRRYIDGTFSKSFNVVHSFWVGSLYHGGLAFGWFVPVFLLYSMYTAWRRLPSRHQVPGLSPQMLVLLGIVFLLGTSFTSSFFVDRQLGFALGVVCAMAFAFLPHASDRAMGTIEDRHIDISHDDMRPHC